MNKAWLVARQEFRQTVSTKAFWIGLLSLPVIICLAVAVPILLDQTTDARRYAVVDDSGWLLAEIDRSIYQDDLQGLAEDLQQMHRQDREAHDRLPEILRAFGGAWRELDEMHRNGLIQALASAATADTSTFVVVRKAELLDWWTRATTEDLDRLHLDLSRQHFARVEVPPGTDTEVALNNAIREGQLFAYFIIGRDPVGVGGDPAGDASRYASRYASDRSSEYVSNNLTDRELRDWFATYADACVRRVRLQREGIQPAVSDWVQASVTFGERRVGAGGEVAEVATRDKVRQWAPAVFTYLLWIAVFTSAQMLLTSTIEEKSARIMEVLVSSVSPTDLLAGKVIGVAGAGLIVVGSWALCLLAGMLSLAHIVGPAAQGLTQVASDPYLLVAFAIYFLLGYLLYAAYLVGLGSLCTSLKESQNLMWPAMMPLLVALMSMTHISKDPNGTMARVLSFIPPLTPFVMMNRSGGPPPLWEYVATTLLLVLSIWLAVRAAARVFRVGILATGSRPSAREVLRWLLAR
ncbi:MAG: ABC transporter permease [bacterium]|nr:ABC transporter permease [bacterium]